MEGEEEVASKGKGKEGMWELNNSLNIPFDAEALTPTHPKEFPALIVLRLAFQSLGVVYGDIGTSPLYVFHSTFPRGIKNTENILGVLSLIIYTLTLIPLIKYTLLVMRVNANGEGGTFALYSIICRHVKINTITNRHRTDINLSTYSINKIDPNSLAGKTKKWLEGKNYHHNILLILVLFGTCMVIGDGILTPAISVLSSVGGIKVSNPNIRNGWVVMLALLILVGLFNVQRFGTDKVGRIFAPTVLIWFLSIGSIGVYNIAKHDPSVLRAFSPVHIVRYLANNGKNGWVSLGGVILSVTGAEALYADLGHFSALPVQLVFALLVFPCLLAAYVGQASFLMKYPEHVDQVFYRSIPGPLYWPMFVIATIAAVVASQATISATFSIIKQAEALGCFPRVKVVHTSKKFPGQIYIPEINWILMVLCLAITAGFRKTTQLGNAYGIAVVAVMLVTTILMALIMLLVWQNNIFLVLLFTMVFLSLELVYFSAVLFKFNQGGWAPLVIAAVFLLVMYVWYYGTLKRFQFANQSKVSIGWILGLGPSLGLVRVPGIGLVYTDLTHGVPSIFSHFITHLPAIHRVVIFVCIRYLPVNTVPQQARFLIRRIGTRDFFLFRCIVRYGYMDLHKKDDGFEQDLLDQLAEFVKENATSSEWVLISDEEDTTASLDISPPEFLLLCDPHQASSSNLVPEPKPEPKYEPEPEPEPEPEREPIAAVKHRVRFAPLPHEEEDESQSPLYDLQVLSEAKAAGVVHILGDVIVKAKRESNLLKKFALDYVYAFLLKICRESSATLNIPHESLFNIGQIYYV